MPIQPTTVAPAPQDFVNYLQRALVYGQITQKDFDSSSAGQPGSGPVSFPVFADRVTLENMARAVQFGQITAAQISDPSILNASFGGPAPLGFVDSLRGPLVSGQITGADFGLSFGPPIPSAPVITSSLTASGIEGDPFTYQITASNSPTSYGATGLPAGLSINTGTGLISGTPTTAATSNITISATNAGGTGSAPLVLTVVPPDPYGADVSLLLHMDGSQGSQTFLDNSLNSFSITAAGDSEINTSNKVFGSGSGYFDGVSNKLNTPYNSAFAFGSEDFTIEMWVYPLNQESGIPRLIGNLDSSYSTNDWTITSDDYAFYSANLGLLVSGDVSYPEIDQWSHIAYCRVGNDFLFFHNGVLSGSNSIDPEEGVMIDNGALAYISVGSSGNGSEYYTGYIDDLRITKGIARYTSAFTPPASAFPNP